MSSTNKTTKLNLNQWIGSDKPKRTDFNHDNNVIDNICGCHINNEDIHITTGEREFWNTQIHSGYYFGSGISEGFVEIGYRPKAVIVYTLDKPFGVSKENESYCGIANEFNASVGVRIYDKGFKVYSGKNEAIDGIIPALNKNAQSYGYIVFKELR